MDDRNHGSAYTITAALHWVTAALVLQTFRSAMVIARKLGRPACRISSTTCTLRSAASFIPIT